MRRTVQVKAPILLPDVLQERFGLHLLKNHLPKKWLLCVEDYAENFRTQFQDEVQSAHYNYEQATLFCVVVYYKCHVCEEGVEESFVGITSDLTHDAHSVHAMKLAFSQHLKSKELTFEHSVAFSDGCAAQFKSKLPFYYLMNSKKDLGYTSQRCFFGTRHGKSQCDSLGGLVKTSATKHVVAREGKI